MDRTDSGKRGWRKKSIQGGRKKDQVKYEGKYIGRMKGGWRKYEGRKVWGENEGRMKEEWEDDWNYEGRKKGGWRARSGLRAREEYIVAASIQQLVSGRNHLSSLQVCTDFTQTLIFTFLLNIKQYMFSSRTI